VRISWFARIAAAMCGVCLLVAGAAGTGVAQAAGPSRQSAATRFSITGEIQGVAVTSDSNAWAVGYSGIFDKTQRTLLLHWNGSKWVQVTSPKPVPGEFYRVSAISADNAWAVGFTSTLTGENGESLIMHWNGKNWSREGPVVPGFLTAVAGTATNVWAVGETYGPALIMHWTGGRWYVVPVSGPGVAELSCVLVTGPDTAWAGGRTVDGADPSANLLLRWNGTVWKSVPSPMQGAGNGVFGLAAGPAGTVLAVGNNVNAKTGDITPLSMAWNGKSWRKVPVPGAVSGLGGVGAIPGGSAWAVGNSGKATVMLRWTGKAWTRVAGPRVASQDYLYAVAASSGRNAWAVGASATSDSGNAVTQTLIVHWNGKTWS